MVPASCSTKTKVSTPAISRTVLQLIWATAPLCCWAENSARTTATEIETNPMSRSKTSDNRQTDQREDLLEPHRLGDVGVNVLDVVAVDRRRRDGGVAPAHGAVGVLDALQRCGRHLSPPQLPAAQHDEQHQGDRQVEEQAAEEDLDRAGGQAG